MAQHDTDLEQALQELGGAAREVSLRLEPEAADRLGAWARLVIAWRGRTQLTGLTTAAAVVRELMAPALYAVRVAEFQQTTEVLDVGAGSGCTGVALANVVPMRRMVLVDRSEKKLTFCRYAVQQCRMEQVEVESRAELAERGVRAGVLLVRAVPRRLVSPEELRRYATSDADVVQWVSQPPGDTVARVAPCGDRGLWVTARPLACFT